MIIDSLSHTLIPGQRRMSFFHDYRLFILHSYVWSATFVFVDFAFGQLPVTVMQGQGKMSLFHSFR